MSNVLENRIRRECHDLYDRGHYVEAVQKAMRLVEIELRERCHVPTKLFGERLLEAALNPDKDHPITLVSRWGKQSQRGLEYLFKGAFGYFRNYAAHDGRLISADSAARALALASELLHLTEKCWREFRPDTTPQEAIDLGVLSNIAELGRLLKWLDASWYPMGDYESYLQDAERQGFREIQIAFATDTGLIKMHEEIAEGPNEGQTFSLTCISLTTDGQQYA